MTIAAPQTVADATRMLKKHAGVQGKVAAIEAERTRAIAAANAAADKKLLPLVGQIREMNAVLEPWWAANAAELTKGERKSIELGGCMIGSRSGRDKLDIAGDEDAIVKTLGKRAWAKPLLKVTTKLDKVAILKSVGGVYTKQLAALGLTRKDGKETFVLERVEQEGTRT